MKMELKKLSLFVAKSYNGHRKDVNELINLTIDLFGDTFLFSRVPEYGSYVGEIGKAYYYKNFNLDVIFEGNAIARIYIKEFHDGSYESSGFVSLY